MQFVEVREYLVNVNNILYIDRLRGRLVMKGKIEILLSFEETEELMQLLMPEQE